MTIQFTKQMANKSDSNKSEVNILRAQLQVEIKEKGKLEKALIIAKKELVYQLKEKRKRAKELGVANEELVFQGHEKQKRATELDIANIELAYQGDKKQKRATELCIANSELHFQNNEKEKRAAELVIAKKELFFQNKEKEKRAAELVIADIELDYQNEQREKRENINKELEAYNIQIKLVSQYARSLLEASRDPLFVINHEGKITDLNNASVIITDQTREKLLGSDFVDYFTEPGKARLGYEEVFYHGFVEDFPLTIKDGKLTPALFNGAVYKDDTGKVLGAMVIARIITEQKRFDNELTEARIFAELATEIAEIAKSKAECATRIAEDAVKAKQQFLSNMSHEIRTPMNAIIGFTKVVLKTDLTEKQKEYVNAIKISGDALIVLINDILDLAKVDAGKMTFEQTPFRFEVSVSAMLHLFETKIQEKNLLLIKEYDNRIPETLIVDPVRLHQIILNLVSNAVKFTQKGKIKVSVQLLSEDLDKVQIEFLVSDTGIGIDEDKINNIFENFQQATSGTSRVFGGTGLGLAIAKQLVEQQGGTIHVKSKIGEGSVFSFILNFHKTKWTAEIETDIKEVESNIKNIKVLVVEDIRLNQLLMKTLLDDFGFEHEVASNGLVAIEKLKTTPFDIVLMDLQMPEMNGFEATDYIRNVMHSNIPIIALTADVTTMDLAKCKEVGMNDYIAKPVDEKILFKKIIGVVKKSNAGYKNEPDVISCEALEQNKYTDLSFLSKRTKSDPVLMMEMISLYLEQTPPLIVAMKNGLEKQDWDLLYSAIHKMIPSFSIMGMNADIENMAKKVQDYACSHQKTDEIREIVLKLEAVCIQVCIELTKEFDKIKNGSI